MQKRAKGQILLDLVFQHLELIEKDYFGLQYTENGVSTTNPPSDMMVIILNNCKILITFSVTLKIFFKKETMYLITNL